MSHYFKPQVRLGVIVAIFLFFSLTIVAQGAYSFVFQGSFPRVGSAVNVNTAVDTSPVDAVDVYNRNGLSWQYQDTLTPDDGGQDFGVGPITINNNTAMIPAGRTKEIDPWTPGAIYIFNRVGSDWSQTYKLLPPAPGRPYAASIELQAGYAAVVYTNEAGNFSGNVDDYVLYYLQFDGTNWTSEFVAEWTNFDDILETQPTDVALTQNTMLVSDFYTDSATSQEFNRVRLFVRSGNTWVLQSTLREQVGSSFPVYQVEMEGNTALIGAPTEGSGVVYVYDTTTWSVIQQLTSPRGISPFGTRLQLSGDSALIGEGRYTYIYMRENGVWSESQRVTDAQGTPVEEENYSQDWQVRLEGDILMVNSSTTTYLFTRQQGQAQEEMLVNGGFEIDNNNDGIPDGWSRKNTTDDSRKCNTPNNSLIAYSGNCAYQFKGGTATNRKLVQNVDLSRFNLNAGDSIKLTGFYKKQSSGDVQVRLFVSYSNLPEDQARVKMTKTTSIYQPIPPLSMTLKAKPTRVRVEIWNQTTSGKTWFDDISLVKRSTLAQTDLIPLP